MINNQNYSLLKNGLTLYSGHDSNLVSILRAFLTDEEIVDKL